MPAMSEPAAFSGKVSDTQWATIMRNCRGALMSAWPNAEPQQINRGAEILQRYVVEFTKTGEVDLEEAERVGTTLRQIFGH
jgi:hypothetical protein